MYMKMKQLDKAKADADKALAADPNNAPASYLEGVILANQGRNVDAIANLKKAATLAKAANNTELLNTINDALKQLGASAP
jgi:tetratricopeptide (TPR) repeat protein